MKKIYFLLLALCVNIMLHAQTEEQLEILGTEFKGKYELVENNSKVRISRIFENLDKSKEDLKDGLVNFFKYREEKISDLNINLINDTYVVTFSMSYGYIGGRTSLTHTYQHYMNCNWRIDVKDNRLRAIVDLSDYTQQHYDKSGLLVKQYTNNVTIAKKAPFAKPDKEKYNVMYTACFINALKKTESLFYYLQESFKMLIKKAPETSTDW